MHLYFFTNFSVHAKKLSGLFTIITYQMKPPYLLLLIFFLGYTLNAQKKLDSIYSVWQDKAKPDSIRVAAYNDYIYNGFLFSQPAKAFDLAEELHTYAQENNYIKAKAVAFSYQGISSSIQGNYAKALDCFSRWLAIEQ